MIIASALGGPNPPFGGFRFRGACVCDRAHRVAVLERAIRAHLARRDTHEVGFAHRRLRGTAGGPLRRGAAARAGAAEGRRRRELWSAQRCARAASRTDPRPRTAARGGLHDRRYQPPDRALRRHGRAPEGGREDHGRTGRFRGEGRGPDRRGAARRATRSPATAPPGPSRTSSASTTRRICSTRRSTKRRMPTSC